MSINNITSLLHKYFLWLVLLAYVIATFLPNFGTLIREVSFGNLTWFDGSEVKLSLPLLMLFSLLFNAGSSIKTKELKDLVSHFYTLLISYAASILLPVLLVFLVYLCTIFWHNPEETQNILLGLAILISMPIASSSAAWAQNSDGNMALSLGLVILSTAFSPVVTPLILHFVGFLTYGDYSEDLHELALNGTAAFLIFSVIVPCFLGVLFHYLMGEERISVIKPGMKLVNQIILLILIYSNAAITLPSAMREPDVDFLVIILVITLVMCAALFYSGLWIARIFKLDKPDASSLMFALGMRNNGGGLVLVAMTLADHPLVMLPLIFYNLLQQIFASLVSKMKS